MSVVVMPPHRLLQLHCFLSSRPRKQMTNFLTRPNLALTITIHRKPHPKENATPAHSLRIYWYKFIRNLFLNPSLGRSPNLHPQPQTKTLNAPSSNKSERVATMKLAMRVAVRLTKIIDYSRSYHRVRYNHETGCHMGLHGCSRRGHRQQTYRFCAVGHILVEKPWGLLLACACTSGLS